MSRKVAKRKPLPPMGTDKHVLYSAAVQSTDADLDFIDRVYRNKRHKQAHRLREDFCGTALLSVDWVERRRGNEAWGIDLDFPTLDWGRKYYIDRMEKDAKKVRLMHENVLTAKTPPIDIAIAFNFSYFIFKKREDLKKYFASVYKALAPDGVLVMDIYGGTSAPTHCWEERVIRNAVTPDGDKLPRFKYAWEHETFNAVTNELLTHIHFKYRGAPWMRRVFTYDWRLWSVPEVREILEEVGFASSDAFSHGWGADGESDHVYRKRTKIINEKGWVGYVAAYK